jgi:hypothetical protein
MKALTSNLAKQILSDPQGKVILRTYLANKASLPASSKSSATNTLIELPQEKGKVVRIRPIVVPKAA